MMYTFDQYSSLCGFFQVVFWYACSRVRFVFMLKAFKRFRFSSRWFQNWKQGESVKREIGEKC